MKQTLTHTRFFVVIGLIIAAAVMRLLPHWPNFTPIAALALFGGAYISRKWLAFLIPLAAMFISDLLLGFHSNMGIVYLAFMLTVLIGFALRKNPRAINVASGSLAASTLFYLLTNLAAWYANPMYPQHLGGLISSYVAGLPFYLNGIAGDLFYSTLLFVGYYLIRTYVPFARLVNP